MDTTEKADLLYGVPAISAYLSLTDHQVYNLHRRKLLPTFKLGKIVCLRRSDVGPWLDRQARAATEGREGGIDDAG
ncbi:DNA-binding protein [Shinella curvata]|uniref:DNA-binding protein n=1 Tax=Shinella curvata TaxID=1817964 RepID=A0ABT8XHL4_9HYPH|nr:DNA-binding protein [Shinella curvata]MCJ8053873.1 DNA-binding protein [Shinella curvata]MDO6123205.1 DNA-binding protein [Shinella curvata]